MAITPESRKQIELEKEVDEILRWFQYGHLPEGLLQQVSKKFAVMALELVERLEYSEQVKLGLYDLLRAKDCFVRAALHHESVNSINLVRKEKPNA